MLLQEFISEKLRQPLRVWGLKVYTNQLGSISKIE